MESEVRVRRKGKKSKVAPGFSNDSFEMEEASDTVKNKVSPFLNNIRDVQSKNNNARSKVLEQLVGAKITTSKWREFVNRRRKRKQTSTLATESGNLEKRGTIGGLGLDDIHDGFVHGEQKVFGDKVGTKTMYSASSRALFQYFAKLGKSQQDDEVVDLDFVETLVDSGANINSTDKHGQTLLHEVASKWHIDVARFLIDMGADVNLADNYGRTPLHVAAADNYVEMVHLLIDNGADRNARTSGELQTPIHYAARNDAVESLKALVKRNCDYKMVLDFKGRTPLHVAAQLDRSETARVLLELDAPAGVSDHKGQATITWMITKMPPVAAEGLQQFHVKDRPNRQQRFYLNLLCPNRDKDPNFNTQMPLQVAVKYKQFDILTHSVFLSLQRIMWDKFARWRAIGSLLFNFIYIVLWTVYGVFIEYDVRHEYKLPEHWWRIVLLIAAVGITVWQIIDEIREYQKSQSNHEKWKKWREEEIAEDMKYCHPRWPEEEKFLNDELRILKDSHTRYLSDWWNWFDWFCYTLLVTVIGTHVADIVHHTDQLARVHIRLTAIVIIFLWLRLMKNIRAFSMLDAFMFGTDMGGQQFRGSVPSLPYDSHRTSLLLSWLIITGTYRPFVVMVGAFITDLLKFAFLYFEFYIPYVCAMWMIFGGNKYPDGSSGTPNRTEITVGGFENFNEAMFSMWRMTLVDEYSYEDMRAIDPIMADILVGTWLFLSAVLCLNLLIALFSDTFQRVYDNARANAVMQKAMMILSFWEGMSHEARNNFLDHINSECSPFEQDYDDDMTESDDADLKKVTIQIKEELDDLKERWHDQFGDGDAKTALEELQEEDLPKDKIGKMITTQKFQSEVEKLRLEISDGLVELQKQQTIMMNKFKQDMKMMKSLLLDLSSRGGPGGRVGGVYGVPEMDEAMVPYHSSAMEGYQQTHPGIFAQPDVSRRPPSRPSTVSSRKKKKRKEKEQDEELLLPGEAGFGLFAQSPMMQQPEVEVSTQDFVSVTDVGLSPHSADHSTA